MVIPVQERIKKHFENEIQENTVLCKRITTDHVCHIFFKREKNSDNNNETMKSVDVLTIDNFAF